MICQTGVLFLSHPVEITQDNDGTTNSKTFLIFITYILAKIASNYLWMSLPSPEYKIDIVSIGTSCV